MNQKIIALGILLLVILVVVGFGKFSGSAQSLWRISNEGRFILPLVIISAFVDSINPCAFSVLLLTIAFLFSIGKLREGILKIGGFYILGLFVIYILIGLGLVGTLHLFNTPNFMAKAGAILMIILGAINLINEFYPRFPIKLKIPGVAHQKMAVLMDKASLPAAFALGGLVGVCEFPCTGGPYLMVLGLLYDRATYLTGLGYLVLYNVIFVLPLVVILLLASQEKLLLKVQAWKREENKKLQYFSGVAMILLGIIIFLL